MCCTVSGLESEHGWKSPEIHWEGKYWGGIKKIQLQIGEAEVGDNFSEYELYATFVKKNYPSSVEIKDAAGLPWLVHPLHWNDLFSSNCCPSKKMVEGIAASGLYYMSMKRSRFQNCTN